MLLGFYHPVLLRHGHTMTIAERPVIWGFLKVKH